MLKNAVRQRKSASIGLIGNCADLLPELALRGVVPDLLTDYTPVERLSKDTSPQVRHRQPPHAANPNVRARVRSIVQHAGMQNLQRLGTRVIDSANAHEYPAASFRRWMAPEHLAGAFGRAWRHRATRPPGDRNISATTSASSAGCRSPASTSAFRDCPRAWPGSGSAISADLPARQTISWREAKSALPILFGCRDAPADLAAADPASVENGACWIWRSPGDACR